jgi:phage terminase large subunit-like protein
LTHVARGNQYARDVVAGRVLACRWVRLACQRHLDDLASSKRKDYPYKFDAEKANKVCRFIEKLPHTKGSWARIEPGKSNRIVLEPWQEFMTCSIFGWVHKANGFRRFREVYVCIPRKNAKSTWAAAVGICMLVADGEYGAEIYSGATTERQAMEVFRTAWRMARRTPALHDFFGVEINAKSLVIEDDGSRFEPVVGDPGDGASPSCAIIDEYHEHGTAILHDTMQTGMGARQQGLIINITTAGSNINGPCYLLQLDVQKMLGGLIANDALFGIIYTIDEGDDWKTDVSLRKANPNYGVSVFAEFLKQAQLEAVQSAHKQNIFKTKHLNVWVNAATAWMNMDAWGKCKDSSLDIGDFMKETCFEGVDLAAKVDLASRMKVFKRLISGKVHYYAFGRHYVPLDRAMDGQHPHYEKWVHEGSLVGVEGVEIQLPLIQREIEADYLKFKYACIAFDPWSALQMQQELETICRGDVILTIDQTTKNLSDAMKEVEAAVLSGRFHHDGDPVLSWAMSNVIAKEDANENVFPRKEKHGKNKIDPVSALLNAMNRAYVAGGPKKSIYSTRGLLGL